MSKRWIRVAAATLVCAGCLAGCSQQPRVGAQTSADVSIGHSTSRVPSVDCGQYQWFWTIDIGDENHGAEAVLQRSGNTTTAKWVKIHDFDGFTGSAWEGGVGSATATVAGDTYTFTGNVFGYGPLDHNRPGSQSFKIVAHC